MTTTIVSPITPLRRLLFSAAALLAVFAGFGIPSGHAAPKVKEAAVDLIGSWEGTFESDSDPEIAGNVTLDITDQSARRLDGVISMLSFLEIDLPFLSVVEGSGKIAASGQFSFVSKRGDGKVVVKGRLTGDTLRLSYVLHTDDGISDHGTMDLVRAAVVVVP